MKISNELKRLSRRELLELLLKQCKRIEELEIKLDDLDKKLKSKSIILETSGNLAEASLKLSHIFEDADEAIALYKENIENQLTNDRINFKIECKEIRDKLIVKTKEICNKKIEQTNKDCLRKEQETLKKCKLIESEYIEKLKKLK